MDIYQFIGYLNSFADEADVPSKDRKSLLQKQMPPYLGHDLITKAKDPTISYKYYYTIVRDAALAQQRIY